MHRIIACLTLVLALAGCGTVVSKSGGATSTSDRAHVDIVNRSGDDPFAYRPVTVTVRVGARVTWRNRTSQEHTVTDTAGHPDFNSGVQHLIRPGASWSYVFHRAGTYPYSCILHPYMKGRVVVVRT